jgi:hypothetical protein
MDGLSYLDALMARPDRDRFRVILMSADRAVTHLEHAPGVVAVLQEAVRDGGVAGSAEGGTADSGTRYFVQEVPGNGASLVNEVFCNEVFGTALGICLAEARGGRSETHGAGHSKAFKIGLPQPPQRIQTTHHAAFAIPSLKRRLEHEATNCPNST